MRFRYLSDRLFLCCVGLYVVNRWVLEVLFPRSFFSHHLNDLICIPFWVPIMLFLLRKLRLRPHDHPPLSYEILVPLITWAVIFEMWLPAVAAFRGLATPDHRDVLFYTLGALIAAVIWRKEYPEAPPTGSSSVT
jgi:hypothetical protein